MPSPDTTTAASTPSASASATGGSTMRGAELLSQIAALDRIVDRMRSITSDVPYALTIPQDDEARYRYTWAFQSRQWLENTPFDPSEHESIQYQTFILHDPVRDMFHQHSLRPKEDMAASEGTSKAGTSKSGNGAGPKKTMSFGMYKKKQAGEAIMEDEAPSKAKEQHVPKKPAAKSPAERAVMDMEVLAAAEKAAGEESGVPVPMQVKTTAANDLKRKRDAPPPTDEIHTNGTTRHSHSPARGETREPSTKKVRTESPPRRKDRQRTPSVERPRGSVNAPSGERGSREGRPKERRTPSPRPSPSRARDNDSTIPPKLSPLASSKRSPVPVPPKLSPLRTTMPPKLSPLHEPDFPPRLSPTMPANIIATLKAKADAPSESRTISMPTTQAKDGKATPLLKPENPTKHKSPRPRNGFRANSNSPAVRSDVEDRVGRTMVKQHQQTVTPDLSPDEEIIVARRDQAKPGEADGPSWVIRVCFRSPKSRRAFKHIIRSNYSSANASLNPARRRDSTSDAGRAFSKASEQRRHDRRDVNLKGVAQKVGRANKTTETGRMHDTSKSSPGRVPDKRPRTADTGEAEGTVKRHKAISDTSQPVDKSIPTSHKRDPTTPVSATIASPVPPQSVQKQATPNMRKEALSSAMRREISSQSISTPSGHSGSPPINHASSTSQPSSHNRALQTSSSTPLQQAWESEQKRLEGLGRELKHIAQDHRTKADASGDNDLVAREQRLAALSSLESLIAYILAFTAADEAARAADPPGAPAFRLWRSLQAYHGFVVRSCKEQPDALVGLAHALGMAFQQRILDLAAAASSRSGNNFHKNDDGRGNGNTHPAPPTTLLSPDSVLETVTWAKRCADETDRRLDVEVLLSRFPRTWSGRATHDSTTSSSSSSAGNLRSTSEKISPGHWTGPYRLPFGIQTPPVQTARAAVAILSEWIEGEGNTDGTGNGSGGSGVHYEMKLKT